MPVAIKVFTTFVSYIHSYINLYIMFILRKVNKNTGDDNVSLGSRYTIVRKDFHKEAFKHIAKDQLLKEDNDSVIAFIIGNKDGDESKIHWVNKSDTCFIMTESGKTFDRIR